jgi:hypothetical protein
MVLWVPHRPPREGGTVWEAYAKIDELGLTVKESRIEKIRTQTDTPASTEGVSSKVCPRGCPHQISQASDDQILAVVSKADHISIIHPE